MCMPWVAMETVWHVFMLYSLASFLKIVVTFFLIWQYISSSTHTVQLTCKVNAPRVCDAVVPHFTRGNIFATCGDCADCYVSGRVSGRVYSDIGN